MRIDLYLFESGSCASRSEAKRLIEEGLVSVDGKLITKPSFDVSCVEDLVKVEKGEVHYASRGGIKLAAALLEFKVNPKDKLAIDVGASSGGFTDCLLQNGAKQVIAVDSGRGQLIESVRTDKRVISIEGYNARYMKKEDLAYIPELAVMDVSFISATYIIPALSDCLSVGADFICLIKPQFEVGRGSIGKGGIVRDEKARINAVKKVTDFAKSCGFETRGVIKSPITGGDGNVEFLAHFVKL